MLGKKHDKAIWGVIPKKSEAVVIPVLASGFPADGHRLDRDCFCDPVILISLNKIIIVHQEKRLVED